jgi:hypothetical protein
VRGGYNIAYERNFGNVTFNVIQKPPNYEVVALTDGGNAAVDSMNVTTNPAGPLSGTSGVVGLPGASLRAVNPNINQSYAELYSLTLEHQIQPNVIFGLDFSGSRGIHLYDIANINSYGSGAVFLGDADPLARLRQTQYSNINVDFPFFRGAQQARDVRTSSVVLVGGPENGGHDAFWKRC